MSGWLAVRGARCDHGASIPAQGISRAGRPWYGLFCPASTCRPSWRAAADPSFTDPAPVSDDEARHRMDRAAVAFSDWVRAPGAGHEAQQGALW